MWQTILVLLLLAISLTYTIRHIIRIARSKAPACSGCSCSHCGVLKHEEGLEPTRGRDGED